jgi:hypothetical protein
MKTNAVFRLLPLRPFLLVEAHGFHDSASLMFGRADVGRERCRVSTEDRPCWACNPGGG